MLGTRLLDPVDQHALVVALPEVDGPAVLGRGRHAQRLDVRERLAAVDLGLAHAQQVQVRPVQHEQRQLRRGHAGHLAAWEPPQG